MVNAFIKDEIKALAAQGYPVHLMADKLDADETALEKFYIDCFAEDSSAFPLRLLATSEWLQKKLQSESVVQISSELQTSPSTIKRLMRIYGISKSKLKDVLTPEVLYSLFVERRFSDRQIAEEYNCSIESVKKLKAAYHISSSDRKLSEEDISLEFFHLLYVKYGFTTKQMAEMFHSTPHYISNTLRNELIQKGGAMADDLTVKRTHSPYRNIISLLFEAVEPTVLLEHLREYPLAKVAEMYDIIPKADMNLDLFTVDWLDYWMKRMNLREIAKQFHVSSSYLQQFRKLSTLKAPRTEDRLDAELVRKLYIENRWNDPQIAKSLGTSKQIILQLRKKHGIKKEDRQSLASILNRQEFERLYLEENLTLLQLAQLYGVSSAKVSELKHQYGKLNPLILSHVSAGVSEQRLQFLKKEMKFNKAK